MLQQRAKQGSKFIVINYQMTQFIEDHWQGNELEKPSIMQIEVNKVGKLTS